jgi:hypothetical protein
VEKSAMTMTNDEKLAVEGMSAGIQITPRDVYLHTGWGLTKVERVLETLEKKGVIRRGTGDWYALTPGGAEKSIGVKGKRRVKVATERVKLDRHGYEGTRYWGVGEPLYKVTVDDGRDLLREWIRASSVKQAKERARILWAEKVKREDYARDAENESAYRRSRGRG